MKCPNCNSELTVGAMFCGNCGQAVQQTPVPPQPNPASVTPPAAPVVTPQANPAPVTATPVVPAPVSPVSTDGSNKAVASLIIAILGLIGSLIPIIGLCMGIVGLILGIVSLKSSRKGLATAGLIISIVTIVASLLFWGINIFIGIQEGEFSFLPFFSVDTSMLSSAFRFNLW